MMNIVEHLPRKRHIFDQELVETKKVNIKLGHKQDSKLNKLQQDLKASTICFTIVPGNARNVKNQNTGNKVLSFYKFREISVVINNQK